MYTPRTAYLLAVLATPSARESLCVLILFDGGQRSENNQNTKCRVPSGELLGEGYTPHFRWTNPTPPPSPSARPAWRWASSCSSCSKTVRWHGRLRRAPLGLPLDLPSPLKTMGLQSAPPRRLIHDAKMERKILSTARKDMTPIGAPTCMLALASHNPS